MNRGARGSPHADDAAVRCGREDGGRLEKTLRPGDAGKQLRRLQASRSYGFVLVLVLFTFVFVAAAPDEAWPRAVLVLLQALTLAVAIWTSAATGRLDTIAAALVVIGVVGAVVAARHRERQMQRGS